MSQSGILKVTDAVLPPDVPTSFVTNSGIAVAINNVLDVLGSGGTTTSGSGNVITITSGPTVATTYTANTGTATPALNNLNVLGASVTAAFTPVATVASGSTVTVNVQRASAVAGTNASAVGLAAFNSAEFTVDSNGFVGLIGGGSAIESINVQTGTSPVVPSSGAITINGAVVSAGTNPIRTDGTGANTLAVEVQISQALAAADATKIGLSNFDSTRFTVSATGFVSLNGSGVGETITGDSGGALSPTTGNWNIIGGTVAAGTSPVKTAGSVSTLTVNVQKSQAIASTDATKIGLAAFDSADFTVDANGFVSATTTGFLKTLTGNSGGAIAPVANNINTVGTGSITIAGSGSTLTTQLTGLTNHAIQIGAGTATLTQLAATATTGQILQNNASADPSWSTATYPSTTTINQILYSSSANVVAGLSTANNGVLTTGTSGIPVITALGTDGQLIIGSSAGAPAAATLTAGTGISITNGHNSISIAVNGSVVGQTITGNSGGALSPTAGNWNILGTNSALTGYSPWTTGSGSSLTLNMPGTVKWIVNPTANIGTHTTITTAMAAASSGDDIFITPGTYTESFTWKAGVNLVAYNADAAEKSVIINGTVSTGAASGTWTASGICFQTNSGYAVDGTGAGTKVTNFYNCYFNATNHTAVNNEGTTCVMNFYYCNGDLGTTGIGFYDQQSSGTMSFNHCYITNSGGSTTASFHTVGDIVFYYSTIFFPILTHAQVTIHAYYSTFDTSATNTTCINLQDLGTPAAVVTISNCRFLSGSASALSIGTNSSMTLFLSDVSSTNTNAITGSGGITYAGVTFSNSSITINTSTKTPKAWPVEQGGTGATTITGLVLGSGTSAMTGVTYTAPTTYTPTCVGGTTAGTSSYTVQSGRYTRIGGMVLVNFNVEGTFGNTAAGNLTVSLPLTSFNTTDNTWGTGVCITSGGNVGIWEVGGNINKATYLVLSSTTTVTATASGPFNCQGTICYFVA